VWFTPDPSDPAGVVPSPVERDPHFPLEGQTLLHTVYGFLMEYTGTYRPFSPNLPILIAVDQMDGQHAILTLTGSEPGTTNNVYVGFFGQNGAQEWRLVASFTGDGTVTVSLPQGLYVCRCSTGFIGNEPNWQIGNIFWVSDSTNLTRVRIRDRVANAAMRTAKKLGFQAQYQSPGRDAFSIWVVPDESNESLSMLGGETGTITLVLHVPRQVDFPPIDGMVPGARVGVNGVWFAFDARWGTETIHLAPVFTLMLRRLDISVEVDGEGV
jgi:hypothetical protein